MTYWTVLLVGGLAVNAVKSETEERRGTINIGLHILTVGNSTVHSQTDSVLDCMHCLQEDIWHLGRSHWAGHHHDCMVRMASL